MKNRYRTWAFFSILLLGAVLLVPSVMAQTAAPAASASSAPFGLKLLMRWLHILAAIIVPGGSFFLGIILLPAVNRSLDAEQAQKLRAAIVKRWKRVVHIGILAFLVSGFYNYLAVTRYLHPNAPAYHILLGVKILLAFGVFFLAIALTGSAGSSESLRRKTPFWLAVLIALSGVIVLIAGYLKTMG